MVSFMREEVPYILFNFICPFSRVVSETWLIKKKKIMNLLWFSSNGIMLIVSLDLITQFDKRNVVMYSFYPQERESPWCGSQNCGFMSLMFLTLLLPWQTGEEHEEGEPEQYV